MTADRFLLWVDDDGEDRFIDEKYGLELSGWTVHWALNVDAAADQLARVEFRAVILDQRLPPKLGVDPEVWGGCALACWLRGRDLPDEAKRSDLRLLLEKAPPLKENRKASIAIVSNFHDGSIRAIVEDLPPPVGFVTKPIDFDPLSLLLCAKD